MTIKCSVASQLLQPLVNTPVRLRSSKEEKSDTTDNLLIITTNQKARTILLYGETAKV